MDEPVRGSNRSGEFARQFSVGITECDAVAAWRHVEDVDVNRNSDRMSHCQNQSGICACYQGQIKPITPFRGRSCSIHQVFPQVLYR
jgi:hypothetical protein